MKRIVSTILILTTPGMLLSCARPATTSSETKASPMSRHKGPATGAKRNVLSDTEKTGQKTRPSIQPESRPEPAPPLMRKRKRPTEPAGGIKPLEADLGTMSSDSSSDPLSFRIMVIKNMLPSYVRRFRRSAMRQLRQRHCADHNDDPDIMVKISFSNQDRIRVTGTEGELARCIKASFRSIAAPALEHRAAKSQPLTIHVRFVRR